MAAFGVCVYDIGGEWGKWSIQADRRGIMDSQTSLSIIPDPRIERCKKHLLADILLVCIISMVRGVESVEGMVFSGKSINDGRSGFCAYPKPQEEIMIFLLISKNLS
jgi:hypothetical protein